MVLPEALTGNDNDGTPPAGARTACQRHQHFDVLLADAQRRVRRLKQGFGDELRRAQRRIVRLMEDLGDLPGDTEIGHGRQAVISMPNWAASTPASVQVTPVLGSVSKISW